MTSPATDSCDAGPQTSSRILQAPPSQPGDCPKTFLTLPSPAQGLQPQPQPEDLGPCPRKLHFPAGAGAATSFGCALQYGSAPRLQPLKAAGWWKGERGAGNLGGRRLGGDGGGGEYCRLKKGWGLAALERKGARVYRGQAVGVSGEDWGSRP